MAKIPGDKRPERTEPLLSDGQGVVANTEDEPLRPVTFLNDHQLPAADHVPEVSYPPGEDPESIAAYKRAGFVVQVGKGGLTGNLKE